MKFKQETKFACSYQACIISKLDIWLEIGLEYISRLQ